MLKSLELFGFKSFADRTRFDFAPGITCVVGPNGSGKSNVVDAIKWILGDQSPKSLRGKEMIDVIFNGSANRKPAALAEALLNFDNRRRVLALDADDVQIGRRIYRSGESEYLINRVPARLKDIKDLFLGTGAGASAYSIIEQGRVDQLLQTTNVNRRNVFEEAAGISRFKARKVDAQRKLERVAQNLLRLTDIVSEVQTQLNALRNQAAKAAKFREYSQELRQLRLSAAADDYRDLGARLQTIEETLRKLAAEIDEARREAEECESRQRVADGDLAEAEERLRAAERRQAENREAIAGFEATARHQTARREELEAEYERLEKQQQDLAARAHEVAGELEQTVGDLERFSGEFEHRQSALVAAEATARELSERIASRRETIDELRRRFLEAVRGLSSFETRATAITAREQLLAASRETARERAEALDEEQARFQRECDAQRALVEAASMEQARLQASLSALLERRTGLQAQQTECRQNLAELREQRGVQQARRTLLDELERRQEGLGVGVREILTLAREGIEPPWTAVLGHVVELLEVDLENAALLEVALGSRAQLIVVEEGRPLVEYLARGDCRISGRVGFLAIANEPSGSPLKKGTGTSRPGEAGGESGVPLGASPLFQQAAGQEAGAWPAPERAAGRDLSGRAGVVCRADRLVRSASGIHRLPEKLLADTWIVSSLESALELAAGTAGGCRFVTLQGELLEANGALYVGSIRSETALVSRKSELRGIKNELARLDQQIAAAEEAAAGAAGALSALAEQEQQLKFDIDLSSHSHAELRSVLMGLELDLERAVKHRADVLEEFERAAGELERLRPEYEEAQAERQRFEEEQRELQANIEIGERELAGDEARLQELGGLVANEQRDLAKFEERLENLQGARTRLDQERFQRDLHREEAQRRFQLLAAKRDQIELELLNTSAVLQELGAQRELLALEAAELQKDRDLARSRRGELAERELVARHRLRDLQDRNHASEMQTTEMRHQITSLADRLRDEFQVELAEIAESGISARAMFVEGRPEADGSGETASDDVGGIGDAPVETTAEEIRARVEEQINKLRRKLKQLGQVNSDSLKELDDLETRYVRLSGQLQDLVEAKNTLEEIIRRINVESKRIFLDSFTQIRENFKELFRKLFGGGEGDIVLENPDDVLECGIDVVARPPGKELRSISLLSGGEKTMTAVALLLAIFKSKPSPFCILDEVDAALDEGNVNRYLGVIKEFQEWTQFIVITHHKRTMAGADVLYGVTMEEAGVSKRMSVRFEDISEDGHFRNPGPVPQAGSGEVTSAA